MLKQKRNLKVVFLKEEVEHVVAVFLSKTHDYAIARINKNNSCYFLYLEVNPYTCGKCHLIEYEVERGLIFQIHRWQYLGQGSNFIPDDRVLESLLYRVSQLEFVTQVNAHV